MFESSKSVFRRCHDIRFTTRYFVGDGIDIGAGPDSIGYYSYMFPGIKSCKAWDLPDGDAQYLESVADNTYDAAEYLMKLHKTEGSSLDTNFVGEIPE